VSNEKKTQGNRRLAQAVLLTLFAAAVLFGISIVYKLSYRVDNIQTAEQSDPLWIGAQLQFEMLRFEKALGAVALGTIPQNDIALRFDIAWSRVIILQEGKLARVIENFGIDRSVLSNIVSTFETIEPQIERLDSGRDPQEVRRELALATLSTLDGLSASLRSFMLDLSQAKTKSMAEFRNGLLSLSHAIAYLGVTILVLTWLLITLLLIELRFSKNRENEMRTLAEEATSASRLKMNFMSVVSHELRTPLTSLLGGLSLLKLKLSNAPTDETTNKLLDVASRNGDRLLMLVNDILDAQALSDGKVSIKAEPVDLRKVVISAVENCQQYAEKLGVEFNVLTPDEELICCTDSDRVSQILNNLVSNAAKFTSSGDVVEVSLTRKNMTARIEVADHGIGIPLDRQKDIFAPFHQINPGTTGANKSSGLGLSITKQLIDLLGGRVGFRSKEGVGSTFWIELKLSPPSGIS
tara:strand:- start:352 stop:1752 length:1401 start_codon:yes stop_codon:yes gene_type:complete